MVHGLDKAVPPPADVAKALLDRIGGVWWNVYIGGPRATHRWKPADVAAYRAQGIEHFLLTYVGRQQNDVSLLNPTQGGKDGEAACQLVAEFGFGAGTPVFLDLEMGTFNTAPSASLDYVEGWCAAVRRKGLRPGVYANPKPLEALAERDRKPDFVWIAHFRHNGHEPQADANAAHAAGGPGLPAHLWQGRRAWQYAGDIQFHGHQVDFDVTTADSGCLTGSPSPDRVAHPTDTEEDMFTFSTAGKPVFFVAGGKAVGLNSANDLQAIRNAVRDLPHFNLDGDTFEQFLRTYRD